MKIYRTLEDGYWRYYSNKIEAKRNAKKATEFYTENAGDSGHSNEEIDEIHVPTTKKGLIEWLNEHAHYTGYSVY